MTKWVYFTEQIYERDLGRKLDEYGERCWELVSLVLYPEDKATHGKMFLAVCKQPFAA
jgi:hypothetical protein